MARAITDDAHKFFALKSKGKATVMSVLPIR